VNRRFLSYRKLSPTYVLVIINITVYAITSFYSGSILETSQQIIESHGQLNMAMFEGQIWRLFTALFIHASIVHVLGNSFFLLIFGLRAESVFNTKEYLFTTFSAVSLEDHYHYFRDPMLFLSGLQVQYSEC